ncbi:MAG: phosphatidylserine/phosphatidylglycerophosphate/cardiolipin synthase family protein [Gammaproteobacteria bacterium]|nr:phosphatidylserine/phosphatidylglycerophosphate/cardiolipin synthase family protein [Gammaproteobacteria bacterium]
MKNQHRIRDSFPWREGNRFQLHVDGGEIFPAMLAAIGAAQRQILLEMYLVESGVLARRFIDALQAAAQRQVGVYLLFDAFGAAGLNQTDRYRLRDAGAQLVFYNPLRYGALRRSLLRDHRKVLVVDERVAFISGVGMTDAFDPGQNPLRYWHDVAVQAEGPVVGDWVRVFRQNWQRWSREPLPVSPELSSVAGIFPGQRGRAVSGRHFGSTDIQRAFIERIVSAKQRVWMMTAYFVPSHRLRWALRDAARRGVDVRLLLPGPITDHPAVRYAGRRFYFSLLRSGVQIFEYQPRFLHAKVLLCDQWVSLGSCNLDRWNLRWNLEGNQEIDDAPFAAHARSLFETGYQLSEECLRETWSLRPWYRRGQEWFWGRVDRFLDRLGAWLRRRG